MKPQFFSAKNKNLEEKTTGFPFLHLKKNLLFKSSSPNNFRPFLNIEKLWDNLSQIGLFPPKHRGEKIKTTKKLLLFKSIFPNHFRGGFKKKTTKKNLEKKTPKKHRSQDHWLPWSLSALDEICHTQIFRTGPILGWLGETPPGGPWRTNLPPSPNVQTTKPKLGPVTKQGRFLMPYLWGGVERFAGEVD